MSEVLNEDQFSKLMDALDIEKPCPEALHQLMASWHRKMTSDSVGMVDFYTHLLLVHSMSNCLPIQCNFNILMRLVGLFLIFKLVS